MSTTASTPRVDITAYAGKETLMRLLRQEYATTMDMLTGATEDELDRATPCAAWTARQLAGHLLDAAFSYNGYFRRQRNGYPLAPPLGMRDYAVALEQSALLYVSGDKWELVSRLEAQVDVLFATFDALGEDDWGGLLVPHKYVGPVPAFMMATFQLMDYSVHNWDFQVALGRTPVVDPESAKTLVPFMFGLWSICFDPEVAKGVDMTVGVEITSGLAPDHWTVTVGDGTFAFAPGAPAEPDASFRFSAADFCLDAYQREQRGEAQGDPAAIQSFRRLFFTI